MADTAEVARKRLARKGDFRAMDYMTTGADAIP